MTIQEQYIELQKCRKQQSSDVLNNKKRIAWEYFRSLTEASTQIFAEDMSGVRLDKSKN